MVAFLTHSACLEVIMLTMGIVPAWLCLTRACGCSAARHLAVRLPF